MSICRIVQNTRHSASTKRPEELAGYYAAWKLRKYSYPTCTLVILTILNSALTLELGPLLMSVREACPHLVPGAWCRVL